MHNAHSQDRPPPRDFRAEVTADIIKMLEEGTAPWQKPWEAGEAGRMPFNPVTLQPYHGGNVVALTIAAMRKGYSDSRWLTFNQAKKAGWHVRKNEHHSAVIEYWGRAKRKPKPGEEAVEDGTPGYYRFPKRYQVFNAEQIEGIPPMHVEPRKPFEVIEAGEKMMADSGAEIRHGGSRAFYTRAGDFVQLPNKEQFIDAPAYYSTAAHELIHWSGNEKRLNRETLTKSRGYNPEDEHYSREELVAEIGSWLVALETGLPHDPTQHTAYIASWLKALKKDKNEIFRAASAAAKASDYVLHKEQAVEAPKTPGEHTARVSEEVQARQGWAR